ncbi:MAG: hypothetical protein HY561_01550, partial [Gemmatimonadetes bacterium]|nr:hypothetical protein [Gemmatimonadota bacterium]
SLAALARRATNGTGTGWYRGVAADVGLGRGRLGATLSGSLWRTPLGTEGGYYAGLELAPSSSLRLSAGVGRSVTDALYGTPGSFGASVGVSWRIGARRPAAPLPVVEVAERAGAGRKVWFRLRSASAGTVALAGDFTGWEPRPMRKQGEVWVLDLVLRPGTYHFSFVLDQDRWLVPDDAPGIIDDGWGRRNGTLVVSGT